MYPAIYIKQIVDKIFSEAGYRYESNFFNSVTFKRLITPFTGGTFTANESIINDKTFKVSNSASLVYDGSGGNTSGVKKYLFDTIIQDTSVPSVDLANDKIDVNSSTRCLSTFSFIAPVTLTNISGGTIAGASFVYLDFNLVRVRNGRRTDAINTIIYNVSLLPASGTITKNLTITFPEIDIENGDEIYIEFLWYRIINPSRFRVTIGANATFSNSPSSKHNEGDLINIGSTLPKEIKQKDFLTWLFRAFNLYAVPDTIDANKLIIEPRLLCRS